MRGKGKEKSREGKGRNGRGRKEGEETGGTEGRTGPHIQPPPWASQHLGPAVRIIVKLQAITVDRTIIPKENVARYLRTAVLAM